MENQKSPILSVSQLIATLNQTLEYAYPSIGVEGEVANFKVNQGKYVFFDLKDNSGSVNCFMTVWGLRMPIEDGMKVVIVAQPKITAWGKFSLTVQSIKPSGEGSIKKSFELLKAKLEKEGLFAPERKRSLPPIPKKVAVISSTQAAGYADFIKIVNDRFGGLDIKVAHTQVQGADAPDQIIRAIEYFNQDSQPAEVLVIIRGGGSADDLSAFNDEKLVRAIAASRIPTLVGVGHEVDVSLSDMAADVRAATPSNAAQILVPDRRELILREKTKIQKIGQHLQSYLNLELSRLQESKYRLNNLLDKTINSHIDILKNTVRLLNQFDPKKVLKRGYAIIRAESGGIQRVKIGDGIEIELSELLIEAEVKNVKSK